MRTADSIFFFFLIKSEYDQKYRNHRLQTNPKQCGISSNTQFLFDKLFGLRTYLFQLQTDTVQSPQFYTFYSHIYVNAKINNSFRKKYVRLVNKLWLQHFNKISAGVRVIQINRRETDHQPPLDSSITK